MKGCNIMLKTNKSVNKLTETRLIEQMRGLLDQIYSNKSSTEYKCHGDITLVPEYDKIEQRITDLKTLLRYPQTSAASIRTMFNTLHKPVFKQMVTEYINEPNDRNTTFTLFFTVGFRVLVGELARIYAATVATEKGLMYKPDKVSKNNDMATFIKSFNESIEKKIDEFVRDKNKGSTVQEGVLKDAFDIIGGEAVFLTDKAIDFIKMAFRAVSQVNPISMVNAILSSAYDRKVAKFDQVSELYEATKEAYNEYLKLPDAQRKAKIESRYKKNIEKYNIKMNNLWAAIEHYDQRAVAEANDRARNSNTSSKPNKPSKPSSPSGGNDGDGDIDF